MPAPSSWRTKVLPLRSAIRGDHTLSRQARSDVPGARQLGHSTNSNCDQLHHPIAVCRMHRIHHEGMTRAQLAWNVRHEHRRGPGSHNSRLSVSRIFETKHQAATDSWPGNNSCVSALLSHLELSARRSPLTEVDTMIVVLGHLCFLVRSLMVRSLRWAMPSPGPTEKSSWLP